MTTTMQGTARLVLEILEHINECATDEEAMGALYVLEQFIQDVMQQRRDVYWEAIDWREE